MKNWIVLPVAIVLSVVASLLTTGGTRTPEAAPASTATAANELHSERLIRTLEALEKRCAELEAHAASAGASQVDDGRRTAVDAVDAAVARWMEANGAPTGATRPAGDSKAAAPQGPYASYADADIETIMDFLLRSGSRLDSQQFWQMLSEEGRTQEVVAEYERLAAEDPSNPDLQVALGGAYLQQLFGERNTPVAGTLAMKADGAFSRALELNPDHWEARFTKAIALSNWPAFLGKSGEAIQNFEQLVEQQKAMPARDEFAQTYLYLGNMYQQTGDMKQALATWRAGLELFPGNETLLEQLRTNE